MRRLILIMLVGLICMASGGGKVSKSKKGTKAKGAEVKRVMKERNIDRGDIQIEGKSWRLKAVVLETDTGSFDVFGDREIPMIYLDKNGIALVQDQYEKLYASWGLRSDSVVFQTVKLKPTKLGKKMHLRSVVRFVERNGEPYWFYRDGNDLVFWETVGNSKKEINVKFLFEEALFEIIGYEGERVENSSSEAADDLLMEEESIIMNGDVPFE